ncbi:MAG: hypothetical protein JNK72_22235 [Myxococcales bacterium]|nr:hypothetical protein [Myxococcales bacterium]
MKKIVLGSLLCALVAVPVLAHATNTWTGWWRHEANAEACMSGAAAAYAVSHLTQVSINQGSHIVTGHAGEYVVVSICVDQVSTLSVSGPSEAVAHSVYDRIRGAWH